MKMRPTLKLSILFLVAIIAILWSPFIGTESLDFDKILSGIFQDNGTVDRFIFFESRLPRVLFGVVAGAALAIAGVVYQGVLRNDLAEPFSLGIASGAALGALLALHYLPISWGALALPLGAFFGSVIAVGAIYGVARSKGDCISPATILLAGVSLNFLFGSAILFIQYINDPFQTVQLMRWLMGGLEVGSKAVVLGCALCLLVVFSINLLYSRQLDILSMGEKTAHNLGVSVERTRIITLASISVLVAIIVAFAGPIAFIGLIVPHAMRRIFGASHGMLLISSLIAGGAFLVLCDTIARTALSPTELPVGILTAFLGAPFFLFLLLRSRA